MADKNLHAVIEIGSKQYLVKVGDQVVSDKQDLKEGEKITVKEVLLTHDGTDTKIGAPYVSGASVELESHQVEKGEKIRVAKFKAKSRYRKVIGHRQVHSVFTVTAINL